MKGISKAFSEKERQHLRVLLLVLAFSLMFLFLVSLRERRSFHRQDQRLAAEKTELARLDKELSAALAERARWEQAEKDLGDLKANYFYADSDGANALRLDLEQLFSEAGISARSIRFDYADLAREKARRVSVTFDFTGTYPVLKRFLEAVEQFPKFLCLQRLDIVRIMGGGTTLQLRVILVGYYAFF